MTPSSMKKILILFSALLLSLPAFADARLSAVFTDHMVIQRDKPFTIWGWADKNEKVRIRFNGQTESVRAASDGSWSISLKPMEMSTNPLSMEIKARNTILLEDVLIGDVWICSGQSNMEWTLRRMEIGEEEAGKADIPNMRMFTVTKEMALLPQNELSGTGWLVARGKQVIDFSAVAYYFGKHIVQETGVPIGLLVTSWGGTNVEAWTSMETLQNYGHIAAIYEGLDKSYDYSRAYMEKSMEKRLDLIKENVYRGKGLDELWQKPGIDLSEWEQISLPQEKDNSLFKDMDGAVWFRKYFDLPGPFIGKDIRINLGKMNDYDMVWVNGEQIGETYEANFWRKYYAGKDLMKPYGNEIVIRVFDYGDEGGVITNPFNLNFHPVDDSRGYQLLAGDWFYRRSIILDKALDLPLDRNNGVNSTPSCLYNQMIHPLLQLSITGAIWYQGESNAGRAKEYSSLFPDMIRDWRRQWKQGDFPFLFVQLAAFQRPGTEESWPELREAQRRALELPNTGMAVTIDIGDPANIHPGNKWDVGKRLALPALKIIYAQELTWSGPIFEQSEPMEGKIKLTFKQVGEGLEARSKYGYLTGFEISEDGENFEFAQGVIKEKNTIYLWNKKIGNPRYVRYAWVNYPADACLFNSEGLPASPFRTGTWKWLTEGNIYGQ